MDSFSHERKMRKSLFDYRVPVKALIPALLLICCRLFAVSDLPTTPVLSVDFFIRKALENDPVLRELKTRARESESRARRIDNENGWKISGDIQLDATRDLDEEDSYEYMESELYLRHPLPHSYGKNAQKAEIIREKSERLAVNSEAEARRRKLIRDAFINYAHYELSLDSLEIVRIALALLQEKHEIVSRQVESGELLERDLVETEQEIEQWKTKDSIYRRQMMYYYHWLLPGKPKHSVPLFRPVPLPYSYYSHASLPPFEDLLVKAQENDPLLESWRIRRRGQWESAPYYGAFPWKGDFRIGPEYTRSDDRDKLDFGVGVSFSFPLSGSRISRARKDERMQTAARMGLAAETRMEELERNLHVWYYHFLEYKQKLRSSGAMAKHRDEIERVLRLQRLYAPEEVEGVPGIMILNARLQRCRTLIDEVLRARTDLADAVFQMEYLSGVEIVNDRYFPGGNFETAIWVWNDEVIHNQKDYKYFMEFCRLFRINRVYLALDKTSRTQLFNEQKNQMKDFLYSLHAANIRCELLLGENSWIFADKRDDLLQIIEQWMDYQISAPGYSRWDGIHLDIEPHSSLIRPEELGWEDVKERYIPLYLETLSLVRDKVKERLEKEISAMKRESGMASEAVPQNEIRKACRINLDIPAWWDDETVNGKFLLDEIFRFSDEVTIMNYASGEEHRLVNPGREIRLGAVHDKGVWIGLEREDLDVERKKLEEIQRKYIDVYGMYPSFRGVSFHSYERLKDMLEKQAATGEAGL